MTTNRRSQTRSHLPPSTTPIIHRHETPLGAIYSTWTAKGLFQLSFSRPDNWSPESNQHRSEALDTFSDQLNSYFESGEADFKHLRLDGSGWTPFTARVYESCRKIAAGQTMTYKELAAASGNEKASRAVGAAMSRNRILLVIPCHRVVSGGGNLRGFSAPGGLETKRKLLQLERDHCWPTDLFATV